MKRPIRARRWIVAACRGALFTVIAASTAAAQEAPAKQAFGAAAEPSRGAAEVIGEYARGCLAGGVQLAERGAGWQTMRPSRNRHFGHPDLLAFIERLSAEARAIGWPGVLVGDMAQPRGGPMRSGHRSHQSGIDVDIWMRPAPERALSVAEREQIGSTGMVKADRKRVTAAWTPTHRRILRAAAEDAAVARIFVNAAIKRRLCEETAAAAEEQDWLRKIRPWWGHDSHFHVRLHCPAGSSRCKAQDPPPPGPGCGEPLDWWFSDEALNPKPSPNVRKRRREMLVSDLPPACWAILRAQ